jgi:hypothetical protein
MQIFMKKYVKFELIIILRSNGTSISIVHQGLTGLKERSADLPDNGIVGSRINFTSEMIFKMDSYKVCKIGV